METIGSGPRVAQEATLWLRAVAGCGLPSAMRLLTGFLCGRTLAPN
jgi:hypothetical protein